MRTNGRWHAVTCQANSLVMICLALHMQGKILKWVARIDRFQMKVLVEFLDHGIAHTCMNWKFHIAKRRKKEKKEASLDRVWFLSRVLLPPCIHTYPWGKRSTKVGNIFNLLPPSDTRPACISTAMASTTCRNRGNGVEHASWNSCSTLRAWRRCDCTRIREDTTTAAAAHAAAAHTMATPATTTAAAFPIPLLHHKQTNKPSPNPPSPSPPPPPPSPCPLLFLSFPLFWISPPPPGALSSSCSSWCTPFLTLPPYWFLKPWRRSHRGGGGYQSQNDTRQQHQQPPRIQHSRASYGRHIPAICHGSELQNYCDCHIPNARRRARAWPQRDTQTAAEAAAAIQRQRQRGRQ